MTFSFRRTELVGVCLLVALFVFAPFAGATRGELLLISRASGSAGTGADGDSTNAVISAGGRYVAFQSDADNLSTEDNNGVQNVFLRDTQLGTTTLVSRADGPSGAGGSDNSDTPSVSVDGRYVSFKSPADNLVTDDNNSYDNVFVRDTQAGTTTLVSRATGAAGLGADDNSYSPRISSDGRYVTFTSVANDLSAEDNDAFTNVFVRDLQAATTTLVSRATGPSGPAGDGFSGTPSRVVDGRYVTFDSAADNLSTDDNNAYQNVFERDLQAGTTILVSRANGASGAGGDADSDTSSVSSGGRFVEFESNADNLSADDDNVRLNIFVRDTQAGTTILISRAGGPSGAGANYDSYTYGSSISADGRYAAFESGADNLSTEDNNAVPNAFVRDIQTAATILVSRASGPSGTGGDGGSGLVTISDDARYVAFQSASDNLSSEDNNDYQNVFRRDLLGGPPHCSDTSRAAAHHTPAAVALPCADDDGDTATREIVSGPAHGVLGAIDQAAGTVSYTPAQGYSGPDSFSFRASDATGSSNTATASLTVSLLPGRCANQLLGTNAGERVSGTIAGDRILGLGGADTLNGLSGADCLDGGTGNDHLNGAQGDDTLTGGSGSDTLAAGVGNDRLVGGAGNDRLVGGAGRNSYLGGAGKDNISAANRVRELIDCGPGRDTVRADRRDRLRHCEVVRRTRR